MTQDLMEYPKLVERAMRQVMREALAHAAEHGLPGVHHFYIGFHTRAPGVEIPVALRAQYPEEMTIVLENKFWDLEVTDTGFAVTLSFGGKYERLAVPFEAVSSFVDPSVKFGLQFGATSAGTLPGEAAPAHSDTAPAPAPETPPAGDGVIALDQFRKK